MRCTTRSLVLLLSGALWAGATCRGAGPSKVGSLMLNAVECTCDMKDLHGDVVVITTSDEPLQLTTDGLASDLTLAPDGRTVAWVAGEHTTIEAAAERDGHSLGGWDTSATRYFASKIVCWRAGRILCELEPAMRYVVNYQFRSAGRQLATSSKGSHGPTYYQLFDLGTGQWVERWRSTDDDPKPAWAEGLPE